MLQLLEKPVEFYTNGQKIYGILHEPQGDDRHKNKKKAIVFLHGWGSYRIGPHRLLVDAARYFCKHGFICLRFDFRGRGESDPPEQGVYLPLMMEDAIAAVKYIEKNFEIEEINLIGICSGGEVALGISTTSPKIKKIICWSTSFTIGEYLGESRKRRRKTYIKTYIKKLFLKETWEKILSGKINVKLILKIISGDEKNIPHISETPESKQMALLQNRLMSDIRNFSGILVFIYGENDKEGMESMELYQKFCSNFNIKSKFHVISDSNHNFYSLKWKNQLINKTKEEIKV